MEWITEFKKLLETSVNPESQEKLKLAYIDWLNKRGSYYSSLKKQCPEFLELLNAIEDVIKVKVKIEPSKAETKEKK